MGVLKVKIIWFSGKTEIIVKTLHGRNKDNLIHWWMTVIKCSYYMIFFKNILQILEIVINTGFYNNILEIWKAIHPTKP